jgi:hypothetical protein
MATTAKEPTATLNLRALADLYERTIEVRNACQNRLRAVDQLRDDEPGAPDVANYPLLMKLEEALDEARDNMESVLPSHPVADWLVGIPGINRTIACRVLGLIPMEGPFCLAVGCDGELVKRKGSFGVCDPCATAIDVDIPKRCPECDHEIRETHWVRTCKDCGRVGHDFETFSELRVFAGICPGRGKLVKGQRACFSGRLKKALFVAFGSMLKAETRSKAGPTAPKMFYPEIYRKWRSEYISRHGEGTKKAEVAETGWPKLRQHFAAKNKLLDVFLCHLWREWRGAFNRFTSTMFWGIT